MSWFYEIRRVAHPWRAETKWGTGGRTFVCEMVLRVPHLSCRMTGGAFEFGPFDGANTLVRDGENRATSANCGSIWSQTFSFDAFGNLTKSGNG